jgi:hypothetical protein
MANVALTVSNPKRAANALPAEVTSNGTDSYTFVNDGHVKLLVRNTTGGSLNVTIETSATVDSQAVGDLTVSIPAGETHHLGDFPEGVYGSTAKVLLPPAGLGISALHD